MIPILSGLAAHNQWANRKIFDACSQIDSAKLLQATPDYDSVIGILRHLVQVEHSFFELAHGRSPRRIELDEVNSLDEECASIDLAYIEYTDSLDVHEAESKTFLVPWFGFEISLVEGVVQPLTHSLKHRADISMLLPSMGGAGLELDYIQWLDEERNPR